MSHSNKVIPALSLLLAGLVSVASSVGLLTIEFYSQETLYWQAQAIGQDMIDLFLVIPCLLITAWMSYRNNRIGRLVWGGVVFYLAYTFIIYCFDVHFNKLFIIYCATLGLSIYSFLYFLFLVKHDFTAKATELTTSTKVICIYLIGISVLFYLLWLSEIIPAIWNDVTPKSLVETGLPTNAVHVLDLSFVLPGTFIAGILILRKKEVGLTLIAVFLTFFILMDVTIGFLVVVMNNQGLESGLSVAIIMGLLACFSAILLVWHFKTLRHRLDYQ